MMKKVLIGIGILALIIIAGFFYLNHRNRTLSLPVWQIMMQMGFR
jgi:uncharacterized protein YxeA